MKTTHRFASGSVGIVGDLYSVPVSNERRPIILILTGDGAKGLASSTWPTLIHRLAEARLNVFGFDFQGLGRSSGARRDLMVSTGSKNIEDAIDYLKAQGHLEDRRLGVVASSFGAAAFLHSVKSFQQFSAVVFKSPVSDPRQTYQIEAGGTGEIRAWATTGMNLRTGLRYEAFAEAAKLNLYRNALHLTAPTLIVHGDMDTIVPIEQSQKLCDAIGPKARLVTLPGVEHDYKAPGALAVFIEETVRFLVAQLT